VILCQVDLPSAASSLNVDLSELRKGEGDPPSPSPPPSPFAPSSPPFPAATSKFGPFSDRGAPVVASNYKMQTYETANYKMKSAFASRIPSASTSTLASNQNSRWV
jgi:hypothetical protein